MVAWRDRLATLGDVTAFDYPYMRAKRKAPDKLPALIAAHREALAGVRARAAGPLSTWVGWPVFFALCFVASVPSLVLVFFVPKEPIENTLAAR